MSLSQTKNKEQIEYVKPLLFPSTSINIQSDDDEQHQLYCCTSGAMSATSLYQLSKPLYECPSLQHSDAENDPSFNVPDKQHESNPLFNEFRKRSLNLNINIHCTPIPKRKQHKAFVSESVSKNELQLILEYSRSIRSSSVQSDLYHDTIGDLGNLSDFTDSTNITIYGPYRAKEELQFVDVDDCDNVTDTKLDLFNHIRIDIPYSAMDILCNNMADTLHKQQSMDDNDTLVYLETNTSSSLRISHFIPKTFDICLVTSTPFNIYKHKDITKQSLDYLQHNLPNRLELHDTVRKTLTDKQCGMRYAHLNANTSTLRSIVSSGGCKILQITAYCCNPMHDMDEYPELCSICDETDDKEYILLECEKQSFGGEGVWYTLEQISEIINAQMDIRIDVIICISPQHERLSQIFKRLGFKYVIGIESASNNQCFSCTETAAFLTHFYDRLLDRTSISHAFDLSLQAALSVRGSIKSSNSDAKYILKKERQHERYLVFHEIKSGDLVDLSPFTTISQTNLREIVRPMIGRAEYISRLLYNMRWTQVINVTGRELIGKATVVKSAVRYLLEMGVFRGGCIVIDCKAKKYQQMSFDECIKDVMNSCNVAFDETGGAAAYAMCFVILNTNEWHNGEEDVPQWIDEYGDILFKHSESRVICTGNKAFSIPSVDVLNMSNLTDLSRSQLASLFMHFCAHIPQFNFTEKDICNHDGLQSLFMGSPGMTQKVAQFVIFRGLNDDDDDELKEDDNNNSDLSLDEIVIDFKKHHNNKRLLKVRDWSSEPYSIAKCIAYFNSIPSPNVLHSESQSMCLYREQTPDPFPLIDSSRSLPSDCALNLNMNTYTIAKEIWIKSSNNQQNVFRITLNDLYPHLMSWFKRCSKLSNEDRIPSLSEMESFFIKYSGIKNGLYIDEERFYGFFSWFQSMCSMMRDLQSLRRVYNNNNLIDTPLFFSRDIAKQHILSAAHGTFLLRFASQINGLAITYKKSNGKISNVLLKRISDGIYKVGKTNKRTDLFDLIHSWSTLKYLYISSQYRIEKDLVFAHTNHRYRSTSMYTVMNKPQLSMKQSVTQKTDEFYAEIELTATASATATDVFDDNFSIKNAQYLVDSETRIGCNSKPNAILDENHEINNQIDEIVMNFSDIAPDTIKKNEADGDVDTADLRIQCNEAPIINDDNVKSLKLQNHQLNEENVHLKKELHKLKHCLSESGAEAGASPCSSTNSCSTPISPYHHLFKHQ